MHIKIFLQHCTFIIRQLIKINYSYPGCLKFSHKLFIHSAFFLLKLTHLIKNSFYLLFACHSGFIVSFLFLKLHLYHKSSHAYHKEFIQISLVY